MNAARKKENGIGKIDWDAKYVLSPEYHIRPDSGRCLIIYHLDDVIKKSFITTPHAIVLSLMDGKRTLGDVKDAISDVFGISQDQSIEIIRKTFKMERTLNGPDRNRKSIINMKALPEGTKVRQYDIKEIAKLGDRYHRGKKLKSPLMCKWILTYKCFTDCIYCNACKRYIRDIAMTPHERNIQLIDEMIEMRMLNVAVTGGDPFMHPHIMEYLTHLNQGGIECNLATKFPLNVKQIEQLVKSGQKRIQISMDAPNEEIANQMIRRKGWFDRIIETIEKLSDIGMRVRVHCVLTSLNIKYAEDIVFLIHSLGVEQIKLTNYKLSLYRHTESMWVPKEELRYLQKKIGTLRERCKGTTIIYDPEKDYSEISTKEKYRGWPLRACTAFKENIVITPDGACVCTDEMIENEEYVLGNINDNTIQEIWDSSRFNDMANPSRELFKGTVCYICEDFETCHKSGYCLRDAYKAYGTIYAPMPQCPKAPSGRKIMGTV